MVAINQVAAPATILLGLASQALALPMATTQQIAESGLLERAVESEIQERDLEARLFMGKMIKGAAKLGKGLLGLREVEERDIEELNERDLAELVQRYFEEPEVAERDVEELDARDIELAERELEPRLFKKLLKGAAKILFRDVDERDFDFDAIVARAYDDDSELDTRDVSDLAERDLETRLFKKLLKGAAKILFRDVETRDIDVDEIVTRAYAEDAELDTRDVELEPRLFKKLLKGAAKILFRDVDDVEERDVEVDELVARAYDEYSELDTRDVELEPRLFKKLLKGAAKILFRDIEERDFEEEMEERDFEELEERDFEYLEERDFDEELETREYEAQLEVRELENRSFKGILKGAAKIGGGLLGFRDLEARDIDDLVTRTLEETDMEIREDIEDISKRALSMFYRDISERDEDLSERDLVYIAARYFDDAQ